jgi:hypothetical protein
MHVNGFNVLTAAITDSLSFGTTTPVTTPLPSTPPASQTTSSTPSSSSLSKGAVAGITVGIVLVVILITTVGWFFFTRSRKGRERQIYPSAMTSPNFATGPQGPYEVDGRSKAEAFELET